MAKKPTTVPARTSAPAAKTSPVPAAPVPTRPAPVPAKVAPPKSTAIAKVPSSAVSVPTDASAMMESMIGVGLENVTANDVLIPRINILQALSPQLQKSKPEFIADAEQGDFCDTGTGEIFRGSITVIPVFFARVYLEWAPRASGKGLIKNHGTDRSILDHTKVDDKNRNVLPNGNYIAETASFYVLNVSAGMRRSFIPLASTQLRAARRWMTMITAQRLTATNGREFTPPIFYRAWEASPVEQSNAEGNWYGWKFDPSTPVPEMEDAAAILAECKHFHEQCRDGLVTGDISNLGEDATNEVSTTEAM